MLILEPDRDFFQLNAEAIRTKLEFREIDLAPLRYIYLASNVVPSATFANILSNQNFITYKTHFPLPKMSNEIKNDELLSFLLTMF